MRANVGTKKILNNDINLIIKHEWIEDMLNSKETIKILDICGGGGIWGIALAKKLIEYNKAVDVIIVDIQKEALENAKKFGKEELGIDIITSLQDVRKLSMPNYAPVDIVLFMGFSTPHFTPWELVKIFAGVSSVLSEDGIFIFDERNLNHWIMCHSGFKEILIESINNEWPIFSIHADYNPIHGYYRRLVFDIQSGEVAPMSFYYWDIACSSAFAWIFFDDVDIILKNSFEGYVLAYKPSKNIPSSKYLTSNPKCLRSEKK